MKTLKYMTISTLISLGVLNSCFAKQLPPLHLYSPVNIQQFMGTWHEIAALPNFFQNDCHCTTDQYLTSGDHYKLNNSCHKNSSNGKVSVSTGKITMQPDFNNCEITAQFFWPFRSHYWVIYHAPDYHIALVGSRSREKLWLLSRKPTISNTDYSKLYKIAKQEQFDVSKLQQIDQSCFIPAFKQKNTHQHHSAH